MDTSPTLSSSEVHCDLSVKAAWEQFGDLCKQLPFRPCFYFLNSIHDSLDAYFKHLFD